MSTPQRRFASQSGRVWLGVLIGGLGVLLILGLIVVISFFAMGRCPMCGGMMRGNGMMMNEGMMDGGEMPQWMMSRGDMGGMMRDMPVIHTLLANHDEIQREVEDVPGGIRAVTTSENPEIVEAIRTHVPQMKERLEEGRPIRMMDPVFREIVEHHDQIEMEIEVVPGGVQVTETSDNPQVVLLIRQHAHRAISEFVEGGMQRAMRPTPLPEGYRE